MKKCARCRTWINPKIEADGSLIYPNCHTRFIEEKQERIIGKTWIPKGAL